jgi:hypothetical protein
MTKNKPEMFVAWCHQHKARECRPKTEKKKEFESEST